VNDLEDGDLERYEMEEEFFISISLVPVSLSIEIYKLVGELARKIEENDLITYVYAGVVHQSGEAYPFIIECMRLSEEIVVFTDFELIDTDELLDLINLNLFTNDTLLQKNNKRIDGYNWARIGGN
tara:strand:+ start:377 stop:754 length:378 start_codon:yes stop_codon:yes gene_type:complete